MAEHRIRLARAWEFWNGPAARRVDLPIVWSAVEARGTVRLLRRFGRPTVDPAEQAITLELADVPGLGAVRLNGRVIGAGPTPIALGGELEARNTLELDLDLDGIVPESPWGAIALVIGPRSG